jgi:hypothetical protein
MAKYGKDYNFHYDEVSLHQHIAAILKRLKNDVQPYIELIQQNAQEKNHGIGNFAVVRMLAPIIETVSYALTISAQDMLNELGIKYSHLYWSLFRDVFSHSDEFEYAYYIENEKIYHIEPALGITYPKDSGSHTVSKKYAMLTVTKLYWDLVNYLEKLPDKVEDRQIKMKKGIEYYPENGDAEVISIVNEMKEIQNK